jgi:hypothetical protein
LDISQVVEEKSSFVPRENLTELFATKMSGGTIGLRSQSRLVDVSERLSANIRPIESSISQGKLVFHNTLGCFVMNPQSGSNGFL